MTPDAVRSWESEGRRFPIAGIPVFVRTAGSGGGVPLAVLHGFPTSSFDFHRVLSDLAGDRLVVLHDHPGFGLSGKPGGYSYSLVDQADVALGVWQKLGLEEVHLLAHDYGTSIATELIARREEAALPVRLRSVTLCNGSVHIGMARLRPIQRMLRTPLLGQLVARLASRRVFEDNMRRLWGDPGRIDEAELRSLWDLLVTDGGRAVLPRIARYTLERERLRDRWILPLGRLDLPCLVLWGDADPVAVPAIAERLASDIPTARLQWLRGVGHYPMLEAPADWVAAVCRSLA